MRLSSCVLLAAATLASAASAAPGVSCGRAKTRIERAICADPRLRRADAELGQAYGDVLRHTEGPVRAAFIAQQSAWISSRDGACATATPDCLAQAYAGRQAQLDALSARVASSDLNLLNDTLPLVLSGSWKAGAPRVLGRPVAKPPLDLAAAAADDGLPGAGTVVTGRPGKLCYGADCFAAGLEPIRLAGVYSDDRATALGIRPGSPAYQVTLTAVHVIRLVQDHTGTLLALFDACAPLHRSCVAAAQEWSPLDRNAAIRRLSDDRPAAGPPR